MTDLLSLKSLRQKAAKLLLTHIDWGIVTTEGLAASLFTDVPFSRHGL